MKGFADGFQVGSNMVAGVMDRKRRAHQDELAEETHRAAMEEAQLRLAGLQRTNANNARLDEENQGIQQYINGTPGTDNSSDRVESRRLGVQMPDSITTPGTSPYDPTNPDQQAGLNRRLMSAAALKGDYAQLQTLEQHQRDAMDTNTFNQAVQRFSMDPSGFDDYTRWVNKNNPMITTAPAKDPRTGQLTGYNIMTVGPTGDAVHKFISPQQAATLAGATALMRTNPTKALQLMATVDQSLAAAVATQNTAGNTANTANNTATHNANADETGRQTAENGRQTAENGRQNAANGARQAAASERTASAAEKRAERENQTDAQKLQEKADAYAVILRQADPTLTPEAAKAKAAGILLKDPSQKPESDVGLAEAGMVKIDGKIFRLGADNKLEPVTMPGEDPTMKALKELAKGGKDPFAAKPIKPGGSKGREASGKVGDDPRKPVSFNGMSGLDLKSKLHGLVKAAESGGRRFNSKGGLLTSKKGAKGEMQVMDDTFKDPGYGVEPARNNSPEERARVGRDYLDALVDEFSDVPKALAAYNAGPGAVKRAIKKYGEDWLDNLPEETQNYVDKIRRMRPRRTT